MGVPLVKVVSPEEQLKKRNMSMDQWKEWKSLKTDEERTRWRKKNWQVGVETPSAASQGVPRGRWVAEQEIATQKREQEAAWRKERWRGADPFRETSVQKGVSNFTNRLSEAIKEGFAWAGKTATGAQSWIDKIAEAKPETKAEPIDRFATTPTMLAGSAEAYSTIIRHMGGMQSPQIKLQQEANKELRIIAKNTRQQDRDEIVGIPAA